MTNKELQELIHEFAWTPCEHIDMATGECCLCWTGFVFKHFLWLGRELTSNYNQPIKSRPNTAIIGKRARKKAMEENKEKVRVKDLYLDTTYVDEPIVEIYNPDDQLIGEITTQVTFNHILVQIKRKALTGYYIIFENKKFEIKPDGTISDKWPEGLFTKNVEFLNELLGI